MRVRNDMVVGDGQGSSKSPFSDESIYSSGSSAAHNASLSRSVAQCPITPGRIGDDGERQEQWVAVPVGTGCCPSNGSIRPKDSWGGEIGRASCRERVCQYV